MPAAVAAMLLDIEGTIAPISFVHDVLFPYARAALPEFLRSRWDRPEIVAVRAQIAQDAGRETGDCADTTAHLLTLMDQDAKTTGLKRLQGLIWERGYQSGALRAELFPDVAAALRRWRAAGLGVHIYSSGSVQAQRLFLQFSTAGDVTPLVGRYFDTTTGPKREAASYRAIAEALSLPAAAVRFFSDVAAELHAAAEAGMDTRLVLRPGNAPVGDGPYHRCETLTAE